MDKIDVTISTDDSLIEIYFNGFYVCSVDESDLSKESKEIIEAHI